MYRYLHYLAHGLGQFCTLKFKIMIRIQTVASVFKNFLNCIGIPGLEEPVPADGAPVPAPAPGEPLGHFLPDRDAAAAPPR